VLSHDERWVELQGALNFRDLGGLPTADGSTTRAGVMFRSDALHHLVPADVELLAGLGVRTVIDLRSAGELERSGRGPLGDTSMQLLHEPLTYEDPNGSLPPALAAGDVGRHYVDSLDDRTPTLARVLTRLSQPADLPAVFHCTAGKDRTGMVAALVLSIVGVADDVIVHDYTLTDARMVALMARLRGSDAVADPTKLDRVARAEAASMETFLAAVHERHGGAEGWARAAGISDATLDALRDVLVDSPS
jgi:protein tyrosine/serine phosphatase